MPLFRQIKEACLYVSDLEASRSFYQDKLGLPVISMVEGRHIFFRVGANVLLCFLPEVTKNDTALPPHYAFGKQHLAFEVDVAEYEEWKQKVINQHIPVLHEQHWKEELYSFYFPDPDGHILEIVPVGIWE